MGRPGRLPGLVAAAKEQHACHGRASITGVRARLHPSPDLTPDLGPEALTPDLGPGALIADLGPGAAVVAACRAAAGPRQAADCRSWPRSGGCRGVSRRSGATTSR